MSEWDSLRERMLAAMPERYQKTVGYPTWDLLNAIAITMQDLKKSQAEAERLLNVDCLSGEALTRYVWQRKGIQRKSATHAAGVLTVTGNGLIEAGALFASKGGVLFAVQETVQITGSGAVRIAAIESGPSGMVGAGTITEIPVTISGITAVINEQATVDGFDAEDDDSLRERFYEALRMPPTSGNIYHYMMWAKEIPGVGGAKVFPLARGPNTVDVILIDAEKQPASDTLIATVQAHIDPQSEGIGAGQAPIGARCYVSAATALPVAVSATVTLLSGWTKEAVMETISRSITEYLQEIAFRQDYVSAGKIAAAINDSDGVLDYTECLVQNGYGNLSLNEREVAILGEVIIRVQG